jgi:hypothetical protein
VAGVDLDESLHAAERVNVFALHLRRERAIPAVFVKLVPA